MSELFATVREAVAALAAADPRRARFGARQHRYELVPVAPDKLPGELPDDVRAFFAAVGAGAGPGYGVVPPALAAPYIVAIDDARWLPLAHLGCGYAALLSLATGEVWADARKVGIWRPLAPSFTAWYLDWIDRLAHARWPEAPVPPDRCALAGALSGYLAHHEALAGLAAGTLAGPALHTALAALGPHAIELAAESSLTWYDNSDRVDPCLACARLLANLAADGLGPTVVAPGLPPKPLR